MIKAVSEMKLKKLSKSKILQEAEYLEREACEYRQEASDPELSHADVADLKAAANDMDGAAIYLRRFANRR